MANLAEMFDMSKMMKDFDPTKMTEKFTQMLKDYKLPGVDVDSIVASQRKNVEALTSANRTVFEGVQAIAKRQAEILQETMNETTKAVDSLSKAGSPGEAAAKQAELAKEAFERALSNMREVAEMASKANEEVASTVNARISATLDEVRDMAMKMKS